MPGNKNYCDNCVPRGCSCNEDENGKEQLDSKGRKYPCCEYFEIHDDSQNDPEFIKDGWEAYYKLHPEQSEKRKESEEVEYWTNKYKDI